MSETLNVVTLLGSLRKGSLNYAQRRAIRFDLTFMMKQESPCQKH